MTSSSSESSNSIAFQISRVLQSAWGDWCVAALSLIGGIATLIALREDRLPLAAATLFFSISMTGILLYVSMRRRLSRPSHAIRANGRVAPT